MRSRVLSQPLSLSLQMTQNWNKGWNIRLSCWQLEGSQQARQMGEQEMKRDLITGNAKSSTWKGVILCTSSYSGQTGRWAAFERGVWWESWWMEAGHEPVMCPCGKGGQCHSAVGEKTCGQQAERGGPSPLYSPGQATWAMLPDLGSSGQKDMDILHWVQCRGMKSLRLESLV